MRLLALRGKNIAALGEFDIAFDRPPLRDAGVFAIIGVNGAGKSSLLDALCLALYGTTPRLETAPKVAIADGAGHGIKADTPAALVRHGARSAYAEADIRGVDGRDYRFRWQQRRARDRAEGALQKEERSIQSLPDGAVSASGISDCNWEAPRLIGLDFPQFCKAVLLSQGEVAAFLKAKAVDRAKLLETLTDTGIFRNLSIKAFEKNRDLNAARLTLTEKRDAVTPLTEAERAALLDRQQADAAKAEMAGAAVAASQAALHWLSEADRLAARLHAAQETRRRAELAQAALADARTALARHLELAPLLPLLAERARRIAEREGAVAALAQAEADRQAADVALAEAQAQHAAARQAVAAAEAARAARDPDLQAARRLDAELAAAWQRLQQAKAAFGATIPSTLPPPEAAAAAVGEALAAAAAAQAVADQAMAALPDLAALQTEAAVAASALATAQDKQRTLAAILALDEERAALQAALDAGAAVLAQARVAAEAARREVERAKATAEATAAAARRLRLATEDASAHLRLALQPGEACPVCGATDHPYAGSAVPESVRAALAEQEREEAEAASVLADCEAAAATADQAVAQQEGAARAQVEQVKAQLGKRQALDPAGRPPEVIVAALAAMESALPALIAARDAADKSLTAAFLAKDEATARVKVAAEAQGRARAAQRLADLAHAASDHGALNQARRALLGGLSVDATVKALDGAVDAARRSADAASAAADTARELAARCAGQRLAAAAAVKTAEAEVGRAVTALLDALQTACADELALAAEAARPAAFAARTEAQLRAADQALVQADADVKAAAALVAGHDASPPDALRAPLAAIPPISRADLAGAAQADLAAARANAKAATEAAAAAAATLALDDDAQKKRATAEAALADHDASAAVWHELASLIGHNKGDSFSKFAQGLSLERLLYEANHRLAELAPRYRILPVPGEEMELQVADLDMAREKRSVAALSGGESFIVALALALALADMAGAGRAGAGLETLLIDEGFGALDADNLALVLDTLAALQAGGRQVGVISHVEELTRSLAAGIRVQRGSGGGPSRVVVYP